MRLRLTGLRAWHPGKLAKGTLAMTAGLGLRTVGQGAVFLIVARSLGVEAYGAYAAVLALAGTLGSFGGFGAQTLLLRDVARDPSHFSIAWGRTLGAISLTTPFLLLAYVLLAWTVLPSDISWVATTMIGVAELLFAPLTLAGIVAYQSHDRIGRAARLVLVPIVPRLGGALMLVSLVVVVPVGSRLAIWSILYCLAALLGAAYAVRLVHRDLGLPFRPDVKGMTTHLREGIAFALSGGAAKLYADIDKTMLARLSTLESAGAYSAGYRVVDMALTPVYALLASTMPNFFRNGQHNLANVIQRGRRVMSLPFFYALIIGGILYITAGWLPVILGEGYHVAIAVLRWLCWLPLIAMPRLMLQSLLTGADRQYAVVSVLGVGAGINISLNLALIPHWSWRGAALSTYAAEMVMTLFFLVLVMRYQRREDATQIYPRLPRPMKGS